MNINNRIAKCFNVKKFILLQYDSRSEIPGKF